MKSLQRWERIAYIVILILALFTRFYILGARTMSHDESLHTKYSWYLYAGQGYQHNPMMHGPILFHLAALAYFLLGVSDFAARFFPAVFGVFLVLSPLLFRRWLGARGTVATSVLLLISPGITYHSRYIRHDIFLMVFGILVLWTILRYIEEGAPKWLYAFAAFFALMFTTMEAYYIYTAIFGLLLLFPFLGQIFTLRWSRPELFRFFLVVLVLVLISSLVLGLALKQAQTQSQNLDESGNTRATRVILPWWGSLALVLAVAALIGAMLIAYYGIGAAQMHTLRIFDVLMVIGTLVLPLGSALIIHAVGFDPLDYSAMGVARSALILAPMLLASLGIGLWWNRQLWPGIALVYYAIFLTLYTTFFTNGAGLGTGFVGALGYWLAQQGVARGGQPWYYYFLQMGLYEYLPWILSIASGVAVLGWRPPAAALEGAEGERTAARASDPAGWFPFFLLGWTLLAWAAFIIAGEKMPWLTVHIALPTIFLSGWGLGHWLEALDAQTLWRRQGWLVLVVFPLTLWTLVASVSALSATFRLLWEGVTPAGMTYEQLSQLGQALGGTVAFLVLGGLWLTRVDLVGGRSALRLSALALVALLGLVTVRTMVRFNYVNYDLATEFMVYAHGTPDVKVALERVEEVSWAVTGSPHEVKVAYGEDGSWPLAWYMVDYPNAYFYGRSPDPNTLLDCPVVFAGAEEWLAVDGLLRGEYVVYDYKYLWWPIQDYWGMSWERLRNALSNPQMRAALWDIFWNRDYRRYAEVTGKDLSLKHWPLRRDLRLYVRRDLAQQLWGLQEGLPEQATITPLPTQSPDPYTLNVQVLTRQMDVLLPGAAPRDVAVAPDGTLFVSDTAQQRIWHVTAQGQVLGFWGEPGTGPGQFNEPWGLAVDAAGRVYVADTWNYRVQVFDAQGTFIRQWGVMGMATLDDPNGTGLFFGPRDVLVGAGGEVYVVDTGNKRVQVFDAEGRYLYQFGGAGSEAGRLNEPVGLAALSGGELVVADTWNYRLQVLSPAGLFLRQWGVAAWRSDSPEVKPYVAVDTLGRVLVSDPASSRVLAFDGEGHYLWSTQGSADFTLVFPQGLAVGPGGVLYVADAHTGRVLGVRLP